MKNFHFALQITKLILARIILVTMLVAKRFTFERKSQLSTQLTFKKAEFSENATSFYHSKF